MTPLQASLALSGRFVSRDTSPPLYYLLLSELARLAGVTNSLSGLFSPCGLWLDAGSMADRYASARGAAPHPGLALVAGLPLGLYYSSRAVIYSSCCSSWSAWSRWRSPLGTEEANPWLVGRAGARERGPRS